MEYLIDGYNYLFTQGLDEELFEEAREQVLDRFNEMASLGAVVVIFDAHSQMGVFSRTFYQNIEVIYTSEDQTADEFILEQVNLNPHPGAHCVISNDKKLIKQVKQIGGLTQSFESFFKKKKELKKAKIKALRRNLIITITAIT